MPTHGQKIDVGVIVGRFQVDDLHEAHQHLIESVIEEHNKVIIFLGLSPARVTRNNPLDFEARKQMILEKYPDVNVLYIKDVGNDKLWSKKLDEQIQDMVGPNASVVLYGGRESFIEHYFGRYDTIEMEQRVYISGSQIRKKVSSKVKASPEFRAGVIWAAHNQYPHVYPTVDVAVFSKDKDKILMAKKPNEDRYRFIGGFSEAKMSYEENAAREVEEEAHIKITNIRYVGSAPIDDWRYRREVDGIVTIFFAADHSFGLPVPDDDICELKWFDIDSIDEDDVVNCHRVLLSMLNKYKNNL
jgi:bifunctional NMN adenylyltransferase/nudix hydrolase